MRRKITAEELAQALEAANGSPSKAAVALGVSRWTVIRWRDRYGLRPRFSLEEAA